jgi:hypothetical protein
MHFVVEELRHIEDDRCCGLKNYFLPHSSLSCQVSNIENEFVKHHPGWSQDIKLMVALPKSVMFR